MDVSKLFLGKQEFTEKEPENPCEYGRRTWDMMNGNALKQNKNLRIMCMGLMGALAVATIGNVYQATQSTVEPYIIEVDSTTGAIRKAGVISEMKYTPEKLEIEYFLGRFIQDTRSLPVDGEVYKQSWYEAYGYMTKDAAAAMSAEMDKQNKAEDFGRKRIKVTINSMLPVNTDSNSYQANWVEDVTDLTTGEQKRVPMTGIFTTTIIQNKDKKSLMENPLGIYVKDFSWSEENVAKESKDKARDK